MELRDLKSLNTIKAFISALTPFIILLYLESIWIKLVAPKLQVVNADSAQFDPVMTIALVFGILAPLGASMGFVDLGLYVGKKIHFYENKWPEEFIK